MSHRPLVTFDLFSALIDSRTGGSAALSALAGTHGWPVTGAALYDTWDQLNKATQANNRTWVPFAEHSRRAMAITYATYDLDGDPVADTERLLQSVTAWPPVARRHPRSGLTHRPSSSRGALERRRRHLPDSPAWHR